RPSVWIMVPMAPSSTRMRSRASRRSLASTGDITGRETTLDIYSRGLFDGRTQAKEMTDRIDQVGAIHRIEVEISDAAVDEIEHLLGGNRSSNELAGCGIVVEPLEAPSEPGRNGRAAPRRKAPRLLEVLHRENPRHHRHVNPPDAHPLEIPE